MSIISPEEKPLRSAPSCGFMREATRVKDGKRIKVHLCGMREGCFCDGGCVSEKDMLDDPSIPDDALMEEDPLLYGVDY